MNPPKARLLEAGERFGPEVALQIITSIAVIALLNWKSREGVSLVGRVQMGRDMKPKVREHTCPACEGTGFPTVRQPVQPGRRIYPVRCKSCDGKGKITDAE